MAISQWFVAKTHAAINTDPTMTAQDVFMFMTFLTPAAHSTPPQARPDHRPRKKVAIASSVITIEEWPSSCCTILAGNSRPPRSLG